MMNQRVESFGAGFDLQLFAAAPSARDLMIGAGKVFFRLWDEAGKPLVRRHMGNVESLNLTPTIEKVQKNSSMDAAKELYAEAIKSMSYKLTLNLNEYNPFNLSLALYGDEGVEIQQAKSVLSEAHEVNHGSPISLPYKNVKNVVVTAPTPLPPMVYPASLFASSGIAGRGTIASSGTYTGATADPYYITITHANSVAGTVTDAEFTWKKGLSGVESAPITVTGALQSIAEGVAVTFAAAASGQDFAQGDVYEIRVRPAVASYREGTDYVLDESQLRGGIITIPDTTMIPDGSKVLVSYDVPEAKYPKVMGGTQKKIEGDLLFVGDPSVGRPYVLEVWHVAITPTGDIGLITDEWGMFTLEMSVISDRMAHPNEPFFRLTNAS